MCAFPYGLQSWKLRSAMSLEHGRLKPSIVPNSRIRWGKPQLFLGDFGCRSGKTPSKISTKYCWSSDQGFVHLRVLTSSLRVVAYVKGRLPRSKSARISSLDRQNFLK